MHFAAASFIWIVFVISTTKGTQHSHQQGCDANAECIGDYEGFNCTCNIGYKGSDEGCENIDECVETPEVCHDAETCTDIIGSYNCTCGDINTVCHLAAVCTSGYNTTFCVCIEGYEGNGTYCQDVDECIRTTDNNCSVDAQCNNTAGSYNCKCNRGYEGDGFVCIDIDECERDTFDCQPPLSCNNTEGWYDCVCGDYGICDINGYCNKQGNDTSCLCNPGYEGGGVECTDVDECKSKHNCHEKATCTNTAGSYKCNCIKGFNGDGKEKCNGAKVAAVSSGVVILMLTSSLLSASYF